MDRKSAVVLGVIFGGLFLALFAFLMLAYSAVRSGGGEDGASGFSTGPAIGVIEVKGVISSVDKQLKALRRFEKDEAIKAILVRIDSPGGSVGPSQELYSELRKAGEKRKVVCSMGSVAASGGMYVAAGCQKVVASPGTLTGSIGVIAQIPYIGDIARELKFKMVTVKSGAMKDAGNPFREMSDAERAYYQSTLDQVHEQFIAAVAEGRGLKVDEVRPFADGRIINGQQAKELKLVDELGSFNDAIRLTAALAGIEGEPRLQYPPEERPFGFGELMREGGKSLARGVMDEVAPRAMLEGAGPAYLAPGLIAP